MFPVYTNVLQLLISVYIRFFVRNFHLECQNPHILFAMLMLSVSLTFFVVLVFKLWPKLRISMFYFCLYHCYVINCSVKIK